MAMKYLAEEWRTEDSATSVVPRLCNPPFERFAPELWIVCNCDPRVQHPDTPGYPDCMKTCFEHMADQYFPSVEAVLAKIKELTAE